MTDSVILDPKIESLKKTAWWLYIFHSVDLVITLGLLSWIPLIINYIFRPTTEGTFVHSHHTWQIWTFWIYLVLVITGGLFFITLVGIPLAYILWIVAWIWKAYRMIKGLVNLSHNMPMQ